MLFGDGSRSGNGLTEVSREKTVYAVIQAKMQYLASRLASSSAFL